VKVRVFVAGATGATGKVFVPLATARGLDLVLHVRPQSKDRSPLGKDPRARVFDLDDLDALTSALAGAHAVVSFVGTMRARFGAGDTYESSDLGSTRALVAGARAAGRLRILLLSSLGAGGAGAYLRMKGECERIVQESGLPNTIFRPSALVSPDGERAVPPGTRTLFRGLAHLPGLGGWADDAGPIAIETVARAFLRVLESPEEHDGAILRGRDLHALSRSLA
jgi:uncharacterized protein YbjT (DUF2867 family)